jgi:hypothetical protein
MARLDCVGEFAVKKHEGGFLAQCRFYCNGTRMERIDSGMNGYGLTRAEAAANLLENLRNIAEGPQT